MELKIYIVCLSEFSGGGGTVHVVVKWIRGWPLLLVQKLYMTHELDASGTGGLGLKESAVTDATAELDAGPMAGLPNAAEFKARIFPEEI